MQIIKVGIVGYGNLGKGVESSILHNKNFKLIKIFSKREGLVSELGSTFDKPENLEKYKSKIDLLFLCGGSYNDIEKIGPQVLKMFNTVDAFDTHAKLENYTKTIDKVAKESEKVAVTAGGWDPGLMSMIRLIFNSIAPFHAPTNSFWGEGVSQGHSDAIRRIKGVKNAIQYTIPNKKIIKNCEKQCDYTPDSYKKHSRLCYVVLDENANANEVKKTIVNMPNYFKGYKTIVKFVSEEKLKDMQKKMYHKGFAIKNFKCSDKFNTKIAFSLDLESNPYFTAEVLLTLAVANMKFYNEKKFGAYTVFDIPLSYLSFETRDNLLKKTL